MVLRIPFSFAMLPPAAALVLLGAGRPARGPLSGARHRAGPRSDRFIGSGRARRPDHETRSGRRGTLQSRHPRLFRCPSRVVRGRAPFVRSVRGPRARRRVAVLRRYLYDQLGLPYLPLSCDPLESGDVFEADSASYVLLPLVSLREAVRSGLDRPRLPRFETDPLNLIPATRLLASVRAGADLGLYVPDRNPCWTAWRIFMVKHEWLLTVDLVESAVLQAAFDLCPYTRMLRPSCTAEGAAVDAQVAPRMRAAAVAAAAVPRPR